MRSVFVHEAVIELVPGTDEAAPGAAVTVGLCGHWEHEGACRWPHNTSVDQRSGSSLRIRTVFACEPGEEQAVRKRIPEALSTDSLGVPPGSSRWTMTGNWAGELRASETALAARLITA